jgi:hypothetical protein
LGSARSPPALSSRRSLRSDTPPTASTAACSRPLARSPDCSRSSCSAAVASNECARTQKARAFLDGAGPAAIGAILGAAITLARALHQPWQFAVLAAAAVALLLLRRGVVQTLIGAGAIGVIAALI